MHIPEPVLTSAVSVALSAIVSWLISRAALRNQERSALHEELHRLNQLAIEYPYLEDDAFCCHPHPKTTSEKYKRYESYCCIVFNLLERTWHHFNGNKRKIDRFLGVSELVNRHKEWWRGTRNTEDNLGAYTDPDFRAFIDSYIFVKPQ